MQRQGRRGERVVSKGRRQQACVGEEWGIPRRTLRSKHSKSVSASSNGSRDMSHLHRLAGYVKGIDGANRG